MQTLSDVHGRAADFKLGRLTAEQQLEFSAHASACEECAETLRLLQVTEAAGPDSITAYRGSRPAHGWSLKADPTQRSRFALPARGVIGFAAAAIIAALGFSAFHRAPKSSYVHGFTAYRSAEVAVKRDGTRAELLTIGMPQPRSGYSYEVYVMGGRSHRSVPTGAYLRLNSLGEGGVKVPGGTGHVSTVVLYSVPALSVAKTTAATASAGTLPVATVNLASAS